MTVRFLRFSMAEVPQGEHATFSFLDLITLALILDAIPDFTHGKVWDGIVCFWLAYANHAIGVRWKISRYLIPPAALTLLVYAFVWCIDIRNTGMKYLAAGLIGAIILIAAVAAYSWIGKKESPPAAGNGTAPPSVPNPSPQQIVKESVPDSQSKPSRRRVKNSAQNKTEPQAQAQPQNPPVSDCNYTSIITDNIFRYGAVPPAVPSNTLMSNNLVQGDDPSSIGLITVEGKDTTVTHNTIENVHHGEIHATKDADRAYIDSNLIRGNGDGQSTKDVTGNGADMEKIRKAQTSTTNVPPCMNIGQPFPDK